MKNKKGITLIEILIVVACIGIVAAMAFSGIKAAIERSKAKAYAEKRGIPYVPPMQEIEQKARSSRISITEVGEAGSITYYIVRDLNTNQEYLVGRLLDMTDRSGLAITKMEK